tara:strand:+ start:38249 stop:41113 length:2865 start_codon:yes stop_codon:yes gene_type:complete
MSKVNSQLNAENIAQYYIQHTMQNVDVASIEWVLAHWEHHGATQLHSSSMQRELKKSDFNQINKMINRVPTGKRKHYARALQGITFYLSDALHWTIPDQQASKFNDLNLQFYDRLSQRLDQARNLNKAYKEFLDTFFKERHEISSAFAALVIAMEVAPLSLNHLSMVLNDNACIERNDTSLCLRIEHVKAAQPQDEAIRFTRYHLPLFVYRILTGYQARQINVTEHGLATQLKQLLDNEPFLLANFSKKSWHFIIQSLWMERNDVVPSFLKDISYPERHVAFIKPEISSSEKAKNLKSIYEQDWDTQWFESFISPSKLSNYSHKKLIKNRSFALEAKAPEWAQDDVLPAMVFYFTQDLVIHGGPRKEVLASVSIYKYSNIESLFYEHPLPFSHAIDQELLHEWAHKVLDSINNKTNLEQFYRFLTFLSCHWLTDHLELSEFEPPTSLPSVDPFCISMLELHEIVEGLITQTQGHLFQRLCCAVTCILAYFAMLRRCEILHLRIQDIYHNSGNAQCFYLFIRKTEGGSTKSRESRSIYATLPEEFAKIVRLLLFYKKPAPVNTPLIGYITEKPHERQLHYLLPVTKAIKAITGQQTRFHHLRHSGIKLFFLQGLHLGYGLEPEQTTHDEEIHNLLNSDATSLRFDYWLEGRSISRYNDNLLLDEMGRQIGHKYYATTRWSYLHGIEWLYPFYRQGYGELQARTFTHPELRYLLGLDATSNDLSRQLKIISPSYANKTLSQRQNELLYLTEDRLKRWIFNRPTLTTTTMTSTLQPSVNYVKAWMGHSNNIATLHFLDFILLKMRQTKYIDMPLLSYIWANSGKHRYFPLTQKQVTALSHLPLSLCTEKSKASLKLELACNVKNAQLFNTVFRTAQWQWLNFSFELTINRKTNKTRQLTLLNTHFTKEKESFKCITQPEGNSQLTISLTPKIQSKEWIVEQLLCFLTFAKQQKERSL